MWTFRYRAASASAYKWEFVGGPRVWVGGGVASTTTSTAGWQTLTGSPTLVAPRAGDYLVGTGVSLAHTVSGADLWCGPAVGAVNPTSTSAHTSAPAANYYTTLVTEAILTGVAAGGVIQPRVYNVTAGTLTFDQRWLVVIPVRVA